MKTSDTTGAIGAALAKAQGAIEGASKDSRNPHFNSKYADLASVVSACREALAKNEISVVQSPTNDTNVVSMVTRLLHSSGEWIESDPLFVQARDAGPQAIGSCVTYLRRYQLAGMAGVAPEDDDAEAAEGRNLPPSAPRPQGPPRPQGQPVQRQAAAPATPKMPPPRAEPPPFTDKDIPFIWLLPLAMALASMAGMA